MSDETRKPLSPQARKRLQMMFERGSQMAAKGEYDYATEMFTQCVKGDPGNLIYVQNFLGNLQRKYNNNKKGSKLAAIKGAGAKTAVTKSQMQKDWPGVIESGLEMLKLNPWHPGTLTAMADACEELEFEECQEAYLKLALDGDMNNIEINRKLARALEAHGDFDTAMLCWQRVIKLKNDDDEAKKGMGNCQVKKTIQKGKYEEAESANQVRADGQEDEPGKKKLSAEQQLEKAISKNPEELRNYLDLAELHYRKENFDQAEEVWKKALEVSGGGDMNIRERLEDVNLRKLRDKAILAEKKALEEPNDKNKALAKKVKEELNKVDLDIYRSRCERYPNNLAMRFELGLRLQRIGQYNEAIKVLQEARSDPQRKGEVHLSLGECFQQIRQVKLAMTNYEQAMEFIPDRLEDLKKRAYYRAGWLSLKTKDLDTAEKYLSELAGMDFGYRDVADLLDKIRKRREEEGDGED